MRFLGDVMNMSHRSTQQTTNLNIFDIDSRKIVKITSTYSTSILDNIGSAPIVLGQWRLRPPCSASHPRDQRRSKTCTVAWHVYPISTTSNYSTVVTSLLHILTTCWEMLLASLLFALPCCDLFPLSFAGVRRSVDCLELNWSTIDPDAQNKAVFSIFRF